MVALFTFVLSEAAGDGRMGAWKREGARLNRWIWRGEGLCG